MKTCGSREALFEKHPSTDMAKAQSSLPVSSPSDVLSEAEYRLRAVRYKQLLECLSTEMESLFQSFEISLGVPMESRVKSWDSVSGKVGRKAYAIRSIDEIDDIAGLRIILLFRRDLEKVDGLISNNLLVIEKEDASSRLSNDQFGYGSNHYVVSIPDDWCKIPSYAGLAGLKAEIQVRTVAQHIWAAASHKLQYKREDSVPIPLRRTISRVSALLETVDLEFDRVLDERGTYNSSERRSDPGELLNVDSLKRISDEFYPDHEDPDFSSYDLLLRQLDWCGIKTAEQFSNLLIETKDAALSHDRLCADNEGKGGHYFTREGMARVSMSEKFGDEALDVGMND